MSLASQVSLLATRIGQEIKSVRSVMLQALSIGTVTTGSAGSSAAATITGTAPTQVLNLTIPQGIQGIQGNAGTAATIAVGTVTTGSAGSSAVVTNAGTSSAATFNFTIPQGAAGSTGPANSLAIGTVTTLAAGASATATITGTAPSQTLNLGIPQGTAGATSAASYTLSTEYAENTQPTSPTTGVAVFSRARAKEVLAYVDPQGQDLTVQSHMAFNRVCRWTAINNNAVPVGDGMGVTAATGATAVASAATNFFTSMSRVAYPTAAATAASLAGFRGAQPQWFLSSTANMGGFYAVWRVGIATSVAGSRGFIGMSTTTSSLAAGSDPSTLLNQFGFGIDAASTNWYFISSGASAGTKVDLGASFPCKTSATDFYEFSLYAPTAGGAKVFWSARRLNDGSVASGSTTTSLPALNTLMVPHVHYTNGTTAASATIHFQSLYIESDN